MLSTQKYFRSREHLTSRCPASGIEESSARLRSSAVSPWQLFQVTKLRTYRTQCCVSWCYWPCTLTIWSMTNSRGSPRHWYSSLCWRGDWWSIGSLSGKRRNRCRRTVSTIKLRSKTERDYSWKTCCLFSF